MSFFARFIQISKGCADMCCPIRASSFNVSSVLVFPFHWPAWEPAVANWQCRPQDWEQLEKASSAASPLVNYSRWERPTWRAFSWMTRASHTRALSGADRNHSLTSSSFLLMKHCVGNIDYIIIDKKWIIINILESSTSVVEAREEASQVS